MYRSARRLADGQWLARLDGNPAESVEEWRAHVAAEYGLAEAEIEVVEGQTDPRVGPLIGPPPVVVQPPPSAGAPVGAAEEVWAERLSRRTSNEATAPWKRRRW